jgi:very-short-patch-repair endonuclease
LVGADADRNPGRRRIAHTTIPGPSSIEEEGGMRFDRETGSSPTVRARSLRRRMTWTEQHLWRELRKLDANFRRQAPIGRYFADFASHGARLIVEVDGEVHERFEHIASRDLERQAWLEGQGYRVLRFTDRQVRDDVFGCAEAVARALDDGTRRAGM